jgi:hypothetical protein
MRQAKLHLIHLTIELSLIDELMMQNVVPAKDWALMRAASTGADFICTGTMMKYDENDQLVKPNKTATTTQPLNPSIKTLTNTSTQKTPTSIMLNVVSPATNNQSPAPDGSHTLHQEFLVITSFNPGVLQCRRRVVNGVDLDCQLFQGMIDESVNKTQCAVTISIPK